MDLKDYRERFDNIGVGCLVKYEDKILLLRRANYPWEHNWLTSVIGSIKPGERFAETARREVKEEVGLSLRCIKPFSEKPYYTYAQDLMSGYLFWMFVGEALPPITKLVLNIKPTKRDLIYLYGI